MLKISRDAAGNVTARNPRYLGLGATFDLNETRIARNVTALSGRVVAYWQPILAAMLLAWFLGLSLVLPSLRLQVFSSPDETSDYIFTKTFAETGKLWYTKDYLSLDNVQLQHPRGGLTDGDRVVFYSYLGLPVTYGLLYKVVGDNLQFISIVFAAVSAWALYRACSLIFAAKAWEVWAVALGFTPLIYYLNAPYFNATPALTLLLVSIWMFAKYFRTSDRRFMVLSAAFAALVVAFRYEYVLFMTPLAVWGLQVKHDSLTNRPFMKDAAIYCGALFFLFAVPLLYFNREIYGSFTSYGPNLFNEIYFPDRTLHAGGSIVVRAIRSAGFMLFPSQVPDVPLLGKNLVRLTIGLLPVFSLTALIGAFAVVKNRSLSPWQIGFMVLLAAYVLLYAGTTDTYQSTVSTPSLRPSIVRYWLPVYTLAFFLGVYALRVHRGETLAYVLALGIVIMGPLSVYRWSDGSLAEVRSDIQASTTKYAQEIPQYTEPNSLIYAGRSDKFITPYRDVSAWWNASNSYEANMVAESMAAVNTTGRPIYIVREPEVDIPELNGALAPEHLEVLAVKGTDLYHLVPASQYLNPAGPPAPESIESNAVVFTDEAGSLLVPSRAPNSWWLNSEIFSDTSSFAGNLARIVSAGPPVYVLGNGSIDVDALDRSLQDYGLTAVNVPGTQFYRIAPQVIEQQGNLGQLK